LKDSESAKIEFGTILEKSETKSHQMKIIFDKVMPHPLSSLEHGTNSIWGNSVEFSKGEKILLNASSGKGKSTFTFSALGLRSDYEGLISYDGIDIRSFDADKWTEIRQRHLSVVFQDLQLFPELSVAENLQLKNDLTGVFKEEELRDMLRHLEIENKWDQKCKYLSMGQQQRVAIIRALCQPFDLLIMDEPFSHLDIVNTAKCLELIDQRCNSLNAGFVLTTLGDDHGFSYSKTLYL
jgi:ABC-type lipoprotein export system ATPase subunit